MKSSQTKRIRPDTPQPFDKKQISRAAFLENACLAIGLVCWVGCSSPIIQRSQSPEVEEEPESSDVALVGDVSQPYGMNYIKVEAIGLATGLAGTGSDPPPSPQRAVLLAEMQRRNVTHAEKILASHDTALVLVRGFLRPGIRKGDRFDIEVRTTSRSEVTSLRGGYLLESRLTELAVLGNQARTGHLLALASGPLLVDPGAKDSSEDDRVHLTQGVVLGGGTALKSRDLGLLLHEEHKSIRMSQQTGIALNRRFHIYVSGTKQGVATPKTDEFIEVAVHPRYKDNVARYMRVLRNLPLRDTPGLQERRLQLLERQLLDPVTSATAAIRLEAIGKHAIDVLRKGLASEEAEVRFHAAEALAYLDQTEAAVPLGEAARSQPAFRVHALAALSTMDDAVAHEQLRDLLDSTSAETRYGAFRGLWAMNHEDPIIRGELLGKQFYYHVLDTSGPAMIHVTRSTRPEIVMFGRGQRFSGPMALEAGKHIIVKASFDGRVAVSRFAVGEPDQKREVSASVDAVIRAVVELGGTYPDVVQLLQQAKESGALASRFKIDALPEGGRSYQRTGQDDAGQADGGRSLPDLLMPWRKNGG